MALRRVSGQGYTNFALGAMHPNGTIYQARQQKTDKWEVVIQRRELNGTYTPLWKYREGKDFIGTMGICQAFPMPDGSVYVSATATYIISAKENTVVQYEDVVPNACPPFTPGAVYQYPVNTVDQVARNNAAAAIDAMRQGIALVTDIDRRLKELGSKAEAKVNEVVAAGRKAVEAAQRLQLDKQAVLTLVKQDLENKDSGQLQHVLWPRVVKMTVDTIYAQLKDANSPLINVIRQGGRTIPK